MYNIPIFINKSYLRDVIPCCPCRQTYFRVLFFYIPSFASFTNRVISST